MYDKICENINFVSIHIYVPLTLLLLFFWNLRPINSHSSIRK